MPASDLTGPLRSVSTMLLTACQPAFVAQHSTSSNSNSSSSGNSLAPWLVRCSSSRCPHCCPGAPWRGEPCGSDSSAGGTPGSCPAQRLATNVSTALLHNMPVLAQAVFRAAEGGPNPAIDETAGMMLSSLAQMLTRLHAERGRQQPTQPRPQPQVAKPEPEPQRNGRQGSSCGERGKAGGGADDGPGPQLGRAAASPASCWRAVVDSVEPMRLLKLQLRYPTEPSCISTGEVFHMLAITHPEALGEAIRADGELRDLMVARVRTAAGAQLRDELQPLALFLEPCKALEVLYGRLGLRRVPRAELARLQAGLRYNAAAPMLVDLGDVAGLGAG